jgi:alpha-tubulin suppressor-like RCC1 family protein
MRLLASAVLRFSLMAFAAIGAVHAKDACLTTAKISTDSAHAAILTSNCEVWMWGLNNAGQLATKPSLFAHSYAEELHKPKRLASFLDVVVAGDHTLSISADRRAYVWGAKDYLSCGGDLFPISFKPQIIPNIRNIKSIAATKHLNAFLTEDGAIYEQGCINRIEATFANVPQRVLGLPRIRQIAVGSNHRLALSESGEVWSWADWNHFGQLGTGDREPRAQPVRVSGIPQIISVSAGSWHSMALDVNGNLWMWGANESWQAGLGWGGGYYVSPEQVFDIPKMRAITSGWFSSAAITTDGRVFIWGNRSGRGYPTPTEIEGISDAESVYIGGNAESTGGILVILQGGNVFRWSPNERISKTESVPFAKGYLAPFPNARSAPFNIHMTKPSIDTDVVR